MRTNSVYGAIFIIVVAVTGCQTTKISPEDVPAPIKNGPFPPFVDLIERKSELALLPQETARRLCQKKPYFVRRPEKAVKMSGAIDRADVNVQWYYNSINPAFPTFLSGDEDVLSKLKVDLTKAAAMGAFEEIIPNSFGIAGYNGRNEPVFHQALLLLSLGIAYSGLEQVYGAVDPDIIAVKAWGNRLFQASNDGGDDFVGRALGVDRAAAKAAAYSVWGISANNSQALAAGYSLYKFVIEHSIGSGGKITRFGYKGSIPQLYYANMTYGWATVAAVALAKAGFDSFGMGDSGATLHDGIDWLVRNILERHRSIAGNADTAGSRTLAWMEYYISRFPDREISNLADRKLNRFGEDWGMNGGMVGGYTTCLAKKVK